MFRKYAFVIIHAFSCGQGQKWSLGGHFLLTHFGYLLSGRMRRRPKRAYEIARVDRRVNASDGRQLQCFVLVLLTLFHTK